MKTVVRLEDVPVKIDDKIASLFIGLSYDDCMVKCGDLGITNWTGFGMGEDSLENNQGYVDGKFEVDSVAYSLYKEGKYRLKYTDLTKVGDDVIIVDNVTTAEVEGELVKEEEFTLKVESTGYTQTLKGETAYRYLKGYGLGLGKQVRDSLSDGIDVGDAIIRFNRHFSIDDMTAVTYTIVTKRECGERRAFKVSRDNLIMAYHIFSDMDDTTKYLESSCEELNLEALRPVEYFLFHRENKGKRIVLHDIGGRTEITSIEYKTAESDRTTKLPTSIYAGLELLGHEINITTHIKDYITASTSDVKSLLTGSKIVINHETDIVISNVVNVDEKEAESIQGVSVIDNVVTFTPSHSSTVAGNMLKAINVTVYSVTNDADAVESFKKTLIQESLDLDSIANKRYILIDNEVIEHDVII